MAVGAISREMSGPQGVGSGTIWGATSLRRALDRLQTLVGLALAVAVLVVVEDLLRWQGVIGALPTVPPRGSLQDWWSTGLNLGLQLGLGLVIAGLVIAGIVVAVLGAISWRRGVLAMAASSTEYGPTQVQAARVARQEHTLTLWLFLVYVLVAIAVSIAVAGTNASLSIAGIGTVPTSVASTLTGLATGGVLLAIYYYGARHLVGLLYVLAAPEGQRLLQRGRDLLVVGAAVGLVAAFAPFSWVLDAAAIASLALILAGTTDLKQAYTLWLSGSRPGAQPWQGLRPHGA